MHSTQPAAELLLHADFVQRLAHALAGRAGDDLAQDTWVRALAAQAPRGNVRGWLAAITGNLWRNRRRGEVRRQQREQDAAPAECVPSVVEIVEREEVRQRVVAAVLQLPESLRAVVLPRFYEGLDCHAIAARLQRPASTVRSQLQAALQRLRQRLDREHGDRRALWQLPLSGWTRALTHTAGIVLRVGWPLRVATAAVLLLAVTWLVLPDGSGGPTLPTPIGPVADAGALPRELPTEAVERKVLPPAVAATAPRGREDLSGRVVTAADDRPVAGAVVELQRCDGDEFGPLDDDYARKVDVLTAATTDRDGRFAFRVARSRLHRLHVRAAGFAPTTSFECVGGSEVTVRVAAGAVVAGVVREVATNKPLADVRVSVVLREGHLDLASQTTTEDGAFRFVMLPAVPVLVSARHDRLAEASERLELQPASEQQLELKLSAGHVAHGLVTDVATGTALPGVEVSDSKSFERRVSTDDAGRYRLPGLDASQGSLLFARADGYCTHWGEQAVTGQDMQHDIAMVRAGTVRGRFVDGNGAGIAGLFAGVGNSFEISIGEATDWCRAVVGTDGRFTIAGLDPRAHYSLYVRGAALGARVLALPQVQAGEVFDVGDMVLRPAGELSGQVVDADGKAMAGAKVFLQGMDADAWQLLGKRVESLEVSELTVQRRQADSEGTFCFGGLAHGSYRLVVRQPGRGWRAEFGPYELDHGEIRDGVRLVIEPGRTITGTLRLGDGSPLPREPQIILLATHDNGQHQAARVANDGSFRFERLDEGVYEISAFRTPAGWSLPVQRGVAANTKDLQLTLQRAALVEGRVVDAAGKPRRARVICWFSHGGHDEMADAEGRFRFEVPPDFVGRFTADDPADEGLHASIYNVAAGTRDLVLRLR